MTNEYCNQTLNREQQQAYYAMKKGLTELSASFPVPLLSASELSEIYFALRMDHPEIFYTVSFRYRYANGAQNAELIPEYLLDRGKIREHREALKARAARIVRPAKDLSPREKVLYVHDFLCENIRYDKLKKPYSHEILGALGQGVAVCEGIAKAAKLLLEELGVPCRLALSEAAPDRGIKYRHAWNLVQLNGTWYHLDCTFDNTLSRDSALRHDYVLLSDRQFFRDHEPSMIPLPACPDGDHTYYREAKLSFTKMEEVKKRSCAAAKKKKPLLFHWRGGALTKEIFLEAVEAMRGSAQQHNAHLTLSVNWAQAVFLADYAKCAEEEKIILEEANEGERY